MKVSMKMMWPRCCTRITHQSKPPLAELTLYLNDSDLAQVKQIVNEIQQRISRFEKRS
jgi:hypothetical protein